VSRLRDQLASGFEIIQRPPSMSPCKVGFVQSRATLMQKSPFISRCQRIRGVKERPIKKYIFEIGPDDNSAEHDDEQSCDGIFHNLFALYRCSSKRQIRRRQLLFLNRFWRTIRAIPLIELGSEMGV